MKVLAIVQARMGSIRLPGKVIKKIGDKTLIQILLERLSLSSEIDKIIVATSTDSINDDLQSHIESLGFNCFRGNEKDVLNRYFESATEFKADAVVRITGDCPLVDAILVDEVIKEFKKRNVDYCSNVEPSSFPDGLDIEVISYKALTQANQNAKSEYHREHVTSFIRESDTFKKSSLVNYEDLSNQRWSVDEPEDLEVIRKVFDQFYPNIFFGWKEVLEISLTKPEIFEGNSLIKNNEGSLSLIHI